MTGSRKIGFFLGAACVLAAAVTLRSFPTAVAQVQGQGSGPSGGAACQGLPSHAQLRDALRSVVLAGGNAGLANDMWATVVNRDGRVCGVAFSGADRTAQWPGSRVISAQKASTANAFSLGREQGGISGLALSTANLYRAVQPGGTLFGLQESNPVDTRVAYAGPPSAFGLANDPMVGEAIGGVNVFGGGLALYAPGGELRGGLGVSGDTSCTDHVVAWKVRHALNLDSVLAGPSTSGDDNIVFDEEHGFSHPDCGGGVVAIAGSLPVLFPLGSTP